MRRELRRTAALIAAVVLAGSAVSACSLRPVHADSADGPQPVFVTSGPGDSPTASPTPPPAPTPAPKKSPSKKPATSPSKRPTETIAPPPGCAGLQGKNLSKTAVKNLLVAASRRQPWVGVQQPANLTKPLPKITVPLKLLRAIAAQESGWQSACKSNDGLGFGLFQVSADTEAFVNNRFGERYDRFVAADNIAIATDNLAWLLVYFGQFHFHETYSWSTTKLFDAVIASFNAGYGTINPGNSIVIPDYAQAYVNAVRQQELPTADCQSWG
ncbi:MAG TPA: lytic transglycosylase domain-containing protein [Micromonosporaceae bacterium]|jgi:soluble lytic murein transglycosylase-like protein